MKKIAVFILFFSCANQAMSVEYLLESGYVSASNILGFSKKCFENNRIQPELYGKSSAAMEYLLSTYDYYDSEKLSEMTSQVYKIAKFDAKTCKAVEADIYKLIATIEIHMAQQVARTQQEQARAEQEQARAEQERARAQQNIPRTIYVEQNQTGGNGMFDGGIKVPQMKNTTCYQLGNMTRCSEY